MKSLRSKLLVWMGAVALAFSGVPEKDAKAIVGFLNPCIGVHFWVAGGLLIASGIGSAIGGFVGGGGGGKGGQQGGGGGGRTALKVLAPLLLVGGIALLDGEDAAGQQLAFRPLTDAFAMELGITPAQQEAFNADYEELNSVAEEVALEVAKMSQPDSALAAEMWKSGLSSFSAETRDAVKKIAAGQFVVE